MSVHFSNSLAFLGTENFFGVCWRHKLAQATHLI
uniref:Uncharacterized protein n=1 Tax=Arundo donax TaxID=35708 RepID=A0A0A9FYJ1_ARUDO